MSIIDDEIARIAAELADQRDAGWSTMPSVGMWAMAHSARGSLSVVDRQTYMDAGWEQERTVTVAALTLELFAEPAGGSALNRELIGPVLARLTFVTLNGAVPSNGVHAGQLRWGPDGEITGTMRGVIDDRSLWPVDDDEPGERLVGRLEARLAHAVIGECLILGAYALDVDDLDGGDVVGTLAGTVLTAGPAAGG